MHVRVPSAVVPATTADAAVDVLDDDFQDAPAFVLVQPRHFAGDAEGGHAVHAGVDEKIDDLPETDLVQVA